MRCCKPRGPILHSLLAFFRKAQSAPGISGAIACHPIAVLSKHGRDVSASLSTSQCDPGAGGRAATACPASGARVALDLHFNAAISTQP